MKLFIANCTRSRFIFNVRVPESNKLMRLEIPSGQQRTFPMDLNPEQREGVLEQLHRYGARKRADVHGKLENFTGLAYSLDKPLTTDEIVSANEDQLDSAQNRSVEQATRSALAADLNFRDKGSKNKRTARKVEIEVLQKTDGRSDPTPMMDLSIDETGSRDHRSLPAARLPS